MFISSEEEIRNLTTSSVPSIRPHENNPSQVYAQAVASPTEYLISFPVHITQIVSIPIEASIAH